MTNKPKLWTKEFIGVWGSNFFLFMSFYFLLVTLPVFAIEELHTSSTTAGLLTTVFLLSAILIRPLTGQWVETIGKRKMLLYSLCIFLAAAVLYQIPQSVEGLLVLRFLHGIGFGMATTATGAMVADIIPDSRRGEGMGYYVMSSNLAMVIGPFLGLTVMNQLGADILFIICAIVSACGLITGFFVKPVQQSEEQQGNVKIKVNLKLSNLIEFSAIRISLVGTFFAVVYASLLSFVAVYAEEVGLSHVSSYFFVVYAIILLLSRPFTGKWYDRYGSNVIIIPCILLFAVGMFVLGEARTAFIFLFAAGLIGLSWGTLFPSFQTIAISQAAPKRRGLATATFLNFYDFGIGFGSFVVGFIAADIGLSSLYMFSSIYILLGLGLYYLLQCRKTSKMEHEAAHSLK